MRAAIVAIATTAVAAGCSIGSGHAARSALATT